MSRKNLKRYLMLVAAIGLVAVAAGTGTFATFNAEVTNTGNTFANGTLFLHQVHGVTTCTSESDLTNNSGTCTALFNTELTGGVKTANIELNNAGTVNASDIKFTVGGCTVGNNSAATGSSVTFGSAPACSDLQLAVKETQSDFSTNVYCAYGTPNGNDCTIDAGHNLTDASTTKTLQTTGPVNADLASGSSRYYVIEIDPSVASDNSLQNRKVSFDITWRIDQ